METHECDITTLEQKRFLRKELRKTLQSLSAAEKNAQSMRICKKLQAHFIQFVDQSLSTKSVRVLLFAGLSDEPDLQEFDSFLRSVGATVLYPRVEGNEMVAVHVDDPKRDFVEGYYGIREPREGLCVASPKTIDIIVVPGVAFASEGMRMGKGKGFYDRFLGRVVSQSECGAIAIWGCCFSVQLVKVVPHAGHDRAMDMVISG